MRRLVSVSRTELFGWFRCSQFGMIRRRTYRDGVAKIKMGDGMMASEQHPRHSRDCKSLRHEEVQMLMLDQALAEK